MEVLTADFADDADGGKKSAQSAGVLRIAAVATDVSWLMNPAGEKFEPTHVGCYGVSSGRF